ncbi:MAG TPA: DUF1800 domain-containing protein [Gemmatimonadales bacterium]|nr:DUF1800 domain-containing protein [Gemmatimonadales bacterium]
MAIVTFAGAPSRGASRHDIPPFTPRDSALHALDRLAYGPRPGDLDRVVRLGVMRWIDQQLDPGTIDDRALRERVGQLDVLRYDRGDLAGIFVAAQEERRSRKQDTAAATMDPAGRAGPDERAARRLAGQFQDLVVVRAVLSERQLAEVMADFWANHFNVFLGKAADRFLLPDYIEHVIRPHALGHFSDLLLATAQSPAMLFYLDNWESVAASFAPRQGNGRAGQRPRPRGINENYARELLELHTLGVDGGYTQQDVINVARILTGWSIDRPRQGGDFVFRARAHDWDEKVVMGVTYPAGHGQDEGIRLLRWLAVQPATIHHVGSELCQLFVNDEPPDGCVDDATAAWRRTDGDIREVVRAIVHGLDFWAAANVRAKVKTPLQFVVSALRALGADPDTTPRLARVVARLGEPLYLHVAPDGYRETQEDWVNGGALLARMTVAVALSRGDLPGASVNLDALLPATPDYAQLVAAVDTAMLAGTMSENTRRVIDEQVRDVTDPVMARELAVGLALGGPEFQRR